MKAPGLRIGFDYWPAATHAPGIGRYLRELVRALGELQDGPRLALLDVGPAGEALSEAALGLPQAADRLLRRRWRARRGWLRWSERLLHVRAETWLGELDLFHRAWPAGAPHARAPQIVALAELPAAGSAEEAQLRAALAGMAAVLVFSEHAEREVGRRLGLAPEIVRRVPVGCDHWLRELGPRQVARERRRLLVLGSVRAGSAHIEVLEAFGRLRGRGLDADLVFCGRRGDAAARLDAALRSNPFRRDVRWIEDPVENEMPTLVAGASLLLQISDEAWTAVTALEAMSLGVAVVASPLPCFLEALGPHARYVEDDHGAARAEALDRAIDAALTQDLDPAAADRRRAHARSFTWRSNAEATLRVYREFARSGRSEG